MFKYVLAFVGGAVVGVSATYLIEKKKYDEKMNQELEEMKNYYQALNELHESDIRKDQMAKDLQEPEVETPAMPDPEPLKPDESKYKDYSKNKYASLTKNYMSDEEEMVERKAAKARRAAKMREVPPEEDYEDENQEPDQDEYEIPGPNDSADPYPITESSFDNEFLYFDKETMTYYPDSHVMIDEDDEIVDDPIALIGDDYLTGKPGELVHARNEAIGSDYRIIIKDGPCPGEEDFSE